MGWSSNRKLPRFFSNKFSKKSTQVWIQLDARLIACLVSIACLSHLDVRPCRSDSSQTQTRLLGRHFPLSEMPTGRMENTQPIPSRQDARLAVWQKRSNFPVIGVFFQNGYTCSAPLGYLKKMHHSYLWRVVTLQENTHQFHEFVCWQISNLIYASAPTTIWNCKSIGRLSVTCTFP